MNYEENWLNGSITVYEEEYVFSKFILYKHFHHGEESYCGLLCYDTLLLSGWCIQGFWRDISSLSSGLKLAVLGFCVFKILYSTTSLQLSVIIRKICELFFAVLQFSIFRSLCCLFVGYVLFWI
jgi:hypothetical protein